MKLHMATYFAVNIVLECAKVPKGELASGSLIAEKIKMKYGYFCKLCNSLIKAGILSSVQGRIGGYYLSRPATEISLYDIQIATGDSIIDNKTWDNEKIAKYYKDIETKVVDSLKEQTIDKFI